MLHPLTIGHCGQHRSAQWPAERPQPSCSRRTTGAAGPDDPIVPASATVIEPGLARSTGLQQLALRRYQSTTHWQGSPDAPLASPPRTSPHC
jgi:hypothetical protein